MSQVGQQEYLNQPRATVGAVNIQIFNPATVPTAQGQTCAYPNTGMLPAAPLNYYYPINQSFVNNQYPSTTSISQPAPQPVQQPVSNPLSASPIKDNNQVPKAPEVKKKREIVQLTDDYIKTLENYMSAQELDVRKTTIKEILNRFKEDKDRYYDLALTKLLNKALRDENGSIRAVALSILGADYASGDNETIKILNQMKDSDLSYNQDALAAAEILLKKSGKKIEVTDNSHYPKKEEKDEKKINDKK